MSDEAIVTVSLSKIYGNKVEALKELSITIPKNSISCILGPNGAGKTTLLRILSTQLLPTSGNGFVLGYDVVKEPNEVRKRIAVVPQEGRPYYMVTPLDEIYFGARIRGFSRDVAKQKTIEILKWLGLYEYRDTKIIKLSGGQRQKVLIGRTLVSDAELFFLDEPTIGLDPVSRRVIWEDIIKLKEEGKTILLTTHYMDEAEYLSDNVFIIIKGRLMAEGSVSSLISSLNMKTLIYINGNTNVSKLFSRWDYVRMGNNYLIKVDRESELLEVMKIAIEEGIKITVKPPSLEDVFIRLVGENYEK